MTRHQTAPDAGIASGALPPSSTRDLGTVLAGLGAWLRAADPQGELEIVGAERAEAGFSSETLLVDLRRAGRPERLVLKLAPSGPAGFPTYDFAMQARVQEAVAAAGIPAPVPARSEDDPSWLGAPFLVMPAVAGHIVDQMPIRDRWVTDAPSGLAAAAHGRYLDLLADLHRIDPGSTGLAGVVPRRDNAAELAHWRAYLAWYGDGPVLVPALVDALDWCEAHRPASEPDPSLLWGDVRLGNVVFDEQRRPVAVLDWEMASIGAAEHDLAWALTLEAVQVELAGRQVPGFLDHDDAVARYQTGLGRSVRDLAWYEIFALVRSTAVMTRISHLRQRAGQPGLFPLTDNPIVDILHRRMAAWVSR